MNNGYTQEQIDCGFRAGLSRVNASAEARKAFALAFPGGPNFIASTPEEYGKLGPDTYYEISSGLGMNNDILMSITVVCQYANTTRPIRIESLSKLLRAAKYREALAHARQYVTKLWIDMS